MEYIEVVNSQNVILNGLYSGKNNNRCIIYFSGLGADFSSCLPHKFFNCDDFDFLFASTQGSSLMKELLLSDGSIISGGAAYESYNNWFSDLVCWFDFLDVYDEIFVVAHSLGCNKVIDYMNKVDNSKVKKVFLLAPQDFYYLVNIDKHDGMLEEALINKKNGNNNLLSKVFLGFCYLSTNTFLDFYYNSNINNIPYISSNDFICVKSIKCQIIIYIGSNDKKISLSEYLLKLVSECRNVSYIIIDGADHNFRFKEDLVVDMVLDEIKKN